MNESHVGLDRSTLRILAQRASEKRYTNRQRLAKEQHRIAQGYVEINTILDEDLIKVRIEAVRRAKLLWFLANHEFEMPSDLIRELRLPGDD